MDPNKTIEELLPRYCEGLTNAAETKKIEEWLAEDTEHEKIMRDIMSINLATDTIQVLEKIDVEKALEKIR